MPIALFFENIFALSLALALFEISIEKNQGWGKGFGPFWGKKFFEGGLIAKVAEKYYLTRYHLVMFCLIVPLILFSEYWGFKIPPVLLIASWLAIGVVEDFLWFVLNWYFPGSLRLLLAGQIWWHPKYWSIGSIKLPRYYFVSSFYVLILLVVQHYLPH